jgi:hypothetical protein
MNRSASEAIRLAMMLVALAYVLVAILAVAWRKG